MGPPGEFLYNKQARVGGGPRRRLVAANNNGDELDKSWELPVFKLLISPPFAQLCRIVVAGRAMDGIQLLTRHPALVAAMDYRQSKR